MPTTAIIAIVLTVTLGFLELLRLGFDAYQSVTYQPEFFARIMGPTTLLAGSHVLTAAAFAGAIVLLFARNVGRVIAIALAGTSASMAADALPRDTLQMVEYLALRLHASAAYVALELATIVVSVAVMVLLSSKHVSRWLRARRKAQATGSDVPTKRPVGVMIALGLLCIVVLGLLVQTYFTMTAPAFGADSQLESLAFNSGFLAVPLAALVAVVLAMIGKKAGWTLTVAVSGFTLFFGYRRMVLFAHSFTVDASPNPDLVDWMYQGGVVVALLASAATIIILTGRKQVDWFHSRQRAIVDNR